MIKKIISLILVLLMAVTLVTCLSGCNASDDNYPVTVGYITLKEKPEKVAVLSDSLADIVYYMGYSTQICAVSDAVTQESITKYISSVGTEKKPDAEAIINSGAELVLVDTPIPETTENKLLESGIPVVTMMTPTTIEQLSAVYTSIGAIFEGNTDGKQNGRDTYSRLVSTLEQAESEVKESSVVKLVCYLYINSDGELCSYNSTTCEGMVLDYVAATNVAANFQDEKVDEGILRLSNPEYIFYDDNSVMEYLHQKSALTNLNALKNKNVYLLPRTSLNRLGGTLIETQLFMLSKMFPGSFSAPAAESLSEKYGITLKEDMSFKTGDDHADIKIIQQRLIDLKYLTLPEGDSTTSYYGGLTTSAVESFQTANAIEATGVADYNTLCVLFASDTLSTEGIPVMPDTSSEAPAETEPAPETEPQTEADNNADNEDDGNNTPQNNSAQAEGYSIDLSSEKSYKRGDENADIKVIQQRLVDLLYMSFPEGESVTNFYGEGTEYAITLFQRSNGLSDTGVADYETLKVLFSEDAQLPN